MGHRVLELVGRFLLGFGVLLSKVKMITLLHSTISFVMGLGRRISGLSHRIYPAYAFSVEFVTLPRSIYFMIKTCFYFLTILRV